MLALVQYAANSGLVAWFAALKTGTQFWPTWSKHYLWTSVTYFAGASAAMIAAKSADNMGFYAVILAAPTVAILFFTYRTYLKNVESAAAQAEQARHHIEELSHYIAEQERIREPAILRKSIRVYKLLLRPRKTERTRSNEFRTSRGSGKITISNSSP